MGGMSGEQRSEFSENSPNPHPPPKTPHGSRLRWHHRALHGSFRED